MLSFMGIFIMALGAAFLEVCWPMSFILWFIDIIILLIVWLHTEVWMVNEYPAFVKDRNAYIQVGDEIVNISKEIKGNIKDGDIIVHRKCNDGFWYEEKYELKEEK